MKKITLLFSLFIGYLSICHAQLANGSPAPDFSVTDINGNGWSLYSEMSGGKSACLDFSATWCAPCWDFHQSHVLNMVNANLSAYTSVVFLEADFKTNTNCLYGPSGCVGGTQGDWVTGTTYPIADLTASNGGGVNSQYKISFVPTLYVISPDFRVWNIVNRSYQEYYDWIVQSFSLNANASVTNSACGDNGSIILDVTGGYNTKTYKWSSGETTKDLVNIPGGTYKVTITDAQGYFKVYGPWTLTGPQRRVAITSSVQNDVKCNGESTGSAMVSASYGTPGYTYSWSNGFTGNNNTNIPAGTYTVTVTDGAGCTVTKTFKITEPPVLKISLSGGDEKCDQSNGFITIVAQGGVNPYTYFLGKQKSSSGFFGGLKSGTYAIDVVDKNNCIVSDIITLNATHKPKLVLQPAQDITCARDTVTLDGQNSDNGPEYIAEWSTRNGKIIGDKFNLSIATYKKGTYQLKITNTLNTCVSIDSLVIHENKKRPDISTEGDTMLNCKLTSTVLKGVSMDAYANWYWTKQGSSFKDTASNITVDSGGTYIFHVLDTLSLCVALDTIIIAEDKTPPTIIIGLPQMLNCLNKTLVLSGVGSDQGSAYEIQWITNNGHFVSGEKTLEPVIDEPGTYVLRIKNATNGCETSQATAVQRNIELPDINFSGVPHLSCIRPELNIVLPIGDPNDFNIRWSTANGHINGASDQKEVIIDRPGQYSLQLDSKVNFCSLDKTFEALEEQKLLPDFEYKLSQLDVQFYDRTSGIVAGRTWTFGDGDKSNDKDPVHHFATEGAFEVCLDVENECGPVKICRNITVGNIQSLALASWEIHPVTCHNGNDGSIKLTIQGGVPPYSILWGNGLTATEIFNLVAGNYSVEIADAQQNKIQKSFTVNQPTVIAASTLDIRHENSGFANGFIHLAVSGGVPGYIYKWSNGAQTASIDNLSAGQYTLEITDANLCKEAFGPYEVKSVLGTDDLSQPISLTLTPNPVKGQGLIEIYNPMQKDLLVVITNISGQEMMRWKVSEVQYRKSWNSSEVRPGVYFVELRSSAGIQVRKWVVE